VLIPLGTDRPLRRPRLVTPVLIGANLAVFLGLEAWQAAAPGAANAAAWAATLRPGNLVWWNLVSYAFLHAGLLHIAGNMLFLWVFGPNLEDRLGRVGFLLFYLAGAVAAGGLHVIFQPSPVIGASGAIAAVTGAYAVLFPGTMIRCFVFFLVIGVYSIPALWFIGSAVLWDLVLQGFSPGDRIARLAHLGGYAFGGGLAFGLRAMGLLAAEDFDLFARLKQAKRRRAFAEAALERERLANRISEPGGDDALATARAELAHLVAQSRFAEAGPAYANLLKTYGREPPGPTTLARRQQRDLANGLLAHGQHAPAAEAYERFARVYPDDPEAPQARLMLALIAQRYLADPARAKAALAEVSVAKLDGDARLIYDDLTRAPGA
jgi:membrane associated rhomboid family serine protease